MNLLRHAEPADVVRLARDLAHRFPHGAFADERDAREVDALLALGRVRDAHYRAQLFVQHHPDSPLAPRIANLMGVHPRPPGVVPEPPDENEEAPHGTR
jgi:hypothetical protein